MGLLSYGPILGLAQISCVDAVLFRRPLGLTRQKVKNEKGHIEGNAEMEEECLFLVRNLVMFGRKMVVPKLLFLRLEWMAWMGLFKHFG